jgi:Ca-activated chloride channel family protein
MATGLVLALVTLNAAASGILIPKDESIPAMAIKSQRVDIRIREGVATAKIEQTFKNSVDRDLEAVYVFPLPPGAAISDFGMWIGGKRVSGELVEKQKARGIYEDIVRRMRDPGLLEYMSGELLRVSVYPVPRNGEQKIEVEYSQQLGFESGLYKFTYPLKTGDRASRTLEDFTVSARIVSTVPIKTIYSPTHKVGITRKGENEAVLGFEEDKSLLDRDFELYYGVSKQAFGLNLLTHAAEGKDGFFMLMLAPAVEPPKGEVIRRDALFVFDTSGSMSGEKIKQAREALKYCVNRLNEGDRFNIVRFSTDVETWQGKPVEVSEANRKSALEFVEKFEARGGTDINGALAAALASPVEKGRPRVVVFLTDGKPTVGTTDVQSILDSVRKVREGDTRIFAFGVGYDVNTRLLDQVSGTHGGVSQYVEPKEDIEIKVSGFYDKISHPVLAKPKVTISGVTARELHPGELADLFAGNQITIFGRYKGAGKSTIGLVGEVNGKTQEYSFDGEFAARNPENAFIPRLWATRRVGYLLEQIRLHGEEKELKEEVIALSKEYAIMTPYTSYLVLETDKDYAAHGIDRKGLDRPMPPPATAKPDVANVPGAAADGWAVRASGEGERMDRAQEVARLRNVLKEAPQSPEARMAHGRLKAMSGAVGGGVGGGPAEREEKAPMPATVPVFEMADESVAKRAIDPAGRSFGFKAESGARAVVSSKALEVYKTKDIASDDIVPSVKYLGKKVFYLIDGVWTDQIYKKGLKETRVKYGSEEYFKLLQAHPDWKQYFSLGVKVILCPDAETAIVVEE